MSGGSGKSCAEMVGGYATGLESCSWVSSKVPKVLHGSVEMLTASWQRGNLESGCREGGALG